MKKITFILVALIAGTTYAQEAATATVAAEIVSPIGIVNAGNLSFGLIASNSQGAETVTVAAAADGERTGDSGALVAGGESSPAKFTITADSDYSYSIALIGSPKLTSGADGPTMDITYTQSLPATGNKVADGPLYVGGTLTVGTSQTAGTYTGEVKVTVAYE